VQGGSAGLFYTCGAGGTVVKPADLQEYRLGIAGWICGADRRHAGGNLKVRICTNIY